MTRDKLQEFSRLTVSLHWIIGITIICMIAVGLYMVENEAYTLYPIHKSVGMLLLVFILVRVAWRAINGWPIPLGDYAAWEHKLARIVHWVLLIGTLLIPLSGMLMSGAGGHGLELFGLQLLASNPDPANPGEVIALNGAAAGLAHEAHEWLGFIMIGAIILHVAGALKHHFVDRDSTLRRMLGSKT